MKTHYNGKLIDKVNFKELSEGYAKRLEEIARSDAEDDSRPN